MNELEKIFNKQDWITKLKEQKKISKETIEAFHYVGDVIEDILSVISNHIDELETLKKLIRKHEHLNGKVVKEI